MKRKALQFLPLAFLAGTHGFALFAPYVAVVLAAFHLRSMHRARVRLAAVPVFVPAEPTLPALRA
jgi:hypothetical protein